jgi:DNA-binding MarR family transcriptional regulator
VTSRAEVAQFLLQSGGAIERKDGRTSSVIREGVDYRGTSTALANLLLRMQRDEEIERVVNGKRCYRVVLTDKGKRLYGGKAAAQPDPEPEKLWTPSASTAPSAPTTTVSATTTTVSLNYTELVTSVRELLLSEQPPGDDDVKRRLGAALEDASRWRERARAWEAQVRDLEKKISELRREVKQKNERISAKDISDLIAVVRKTPGWSVEKRSGHWHIHSPEGKRVIMSSTPSDPRSMLNSRADLRKAGLPI